ncbi:MAG TPA: DUF5692 family protein [Spirochaetia bacterium]|nr:DUF5692 family protein [Spirochaetales bacterium]HQG40728.1 DUF5692 family protein [Spirochaetales bacterium]HQK33091.1 DUF5692 family protein [Spirochaetales bacterium]HRS66312.1 DUF5692 family protein [Spirochaetia bacterium]
MFLFETLSAGQVFMWFAVLAALMLLNELARANKWAALALFLVLPIILTFTVWIKTAVPDTSVGTWFHWAKVYSVLAGCLVVWAIRFIKGMETKKAVLFLPALILALNITEAVVRDFQVSTFNGVRDGMLLVGGPWNIMNGIAGILNIIAISGWMGIFVDRKHKQQDMIWPDMLWPWIIAYDLWNFAYVYNCVPDHAFYAGLALLLSCTIPAFFIKRGAWLQHRAHTLAFWMMFVMTYPSFVDTSAYAVKSSHSTTALWVVSGLSLVVNVVVTGYHVYRLIKNKVNPFKAEVYTDLQAYKKIAELKG